MKDNWKFIAVNWQLCQSPLRPSTEDLSFIQRRIDSCYSSVLGLNVLVLGVTPDYHSLRMPPDSTIRVMDISMKMIKLVWPGSQTAAIHANWQHMPLAALSQDIVLLDGGMSLLSYPKGQQQVLQELQRVIKPGGSFIVRLFVLPHIHEHSEEVLRAVESGSIREISELKLRLWTSMQQDPVKGLNHKVVWQMLEDHWPAFTGLAALLDIDANHLQQASDSTDLRVSHFLSLAQYKQFFSEHASGFKLEAEYTPSYAAGDRSPTLVFSRIE